MARHTRLELDCYSLALRPSDATIFPHKHFGQRVAIKGYANVAVKDSLGNYRVVRTPGLIPINSRRANEVARIAKGNGSMADTSATAIALLFVCNRIVLVTPIPIVGNASQRAGDLIPQWIPLVASQVESFMMRQYNDIAVRELKSDTAQESALDRIDGTLLVKSLRRGVVSAVEADHHPMFVVKRKV